MEDYMLLLDNIGSLLEEGRKKAYYEINSIIVKTYWEIGRKIVEYGSHEKTNAGYGHRLIDNISRDLKNKYGKGFSRSNVYMMKELYLKYQKIQTLSGKLEYALGGITNKLFLSKYKLYLPDKKELRNRLRTLLMD